MLSDLCENTGIEAFTHRSVIRYWQGKSREATKDYRRMPTINRPFVAIIMTVGLLLVHYSKLHILNVDEITEKGR